MTEVQGLLQINVRFADKFVGTIYPVTYELKLYDRACLRNERSGRPN